MPSRGRHLLIKVALPLEMNGFGTQIEPLDFLSHLSALLSVCVDFILSNCGKAKDLAAGSFRCTKSQFGNPHKVEPFL